VVTDFTSSDIIRLTNATGTSAAGAGATTTSAGTNVAVSSGGKVTFATDDDTLAEKLVAIKADDTDLANGEVAFFEDSGNTYVFFAGDDTTAAADAVLIKLTGVAGFTTITESGTTANDYTLS